MFLYCITSGYPGAGVDETANSATSRFLSERAELPAALRSAQRPLRRSRCHAISDTQTGALSMTGSMRRGVEFFVQTVLRNVLEYALKYTLHGGDVTMRILSVQGTAVVEIVDRDSRIAQAKRERVFDAPNQSSGEIAPRQAFAR